MKLRTLSLLVGITTLSFGQTHQPAQVAPGTMEMSALSIERTEGDMRTNEIRDELASLREQRGQMTSIYTGKYSKVQALDAQIASLEAALKAAPQRDTHLIHLKGNVEIRTDTMTLTANEAYYNQATGEIEALGTVRIKPLSK
jgi:lipopolysaccharide assembly outer membrane protein LptD (OstA)